MDTYSKDLIDVISSIGGLITVIVGIFMAFYQINKNRKQREREINKRELDVKTRQEQKERELEKREFEIKTQRAIFWLELRKMFSKCDETHRRLRYGTWPNPYNSELHLQDEEELTIEQLPELEAYMGLFEHCKYMIDDGLIDIPTFKSIYAYRIHNIVNNERIVELKFKNPRTRDGWKDFIELAEMFGIEVPE